MRIRELFEYTHVIQKGDTLWDLSRKYKIPMKQIAKANNMKSINDIIRPGQKLVIPGVEVTPPTPMTRPTTQKVPSLTTASPNYPTPPAAGLPAMDPVAAAKARADAASKQAAALQAQVDAGNAALSARQRADDLSKFRSADAQSMAKLSAQQPAPSLDPDVVQKWAQRNISQGKTSSGMNPSGISNADLADQEAAYQDRLAQADAEEAARLAKINAYVKAPKTIDVPTDFDWSKLGQANLAKGKTTSGIPTTPTTPTVATPTPSVVDNSQLAQTMRAGGSTISDIANKLGVGLLDVLDLINK